MNVFTRKNALVGFVTLKAVKRKLKRRRQSRVRRALAVVLGVASLGAIAGVAILLLRRQHGDETAIAESDDEIVGEVVTAASEPIPAT
jgi:uncharacterized membrane protein